MATWKVARLSKVCAATGKPLPPDSPVVTALFDVKGAGEEDVTDDKVKGTGLARKDFLPEAATPEALAGAFCVWRGKTPPENPTKTLRLDLAMARDLLERLLAQDDPSRGPALLTLALLLIRKRRLALVAEREGRLTCRWPKETSTFDVPAPTITEAEEATLEQELLRLFEV
jgi:hypothetical protein